MILLYSLFYDPNNLHCFQLIKIQAIFIGINSTIAPLYLFEIAPKKIRGSIGSIHETSTIFAMFLTQLFGLPMVFGTDELWPLIFAVSTVPIAVQLLTLPFCPESPKFTLINRGNIKQAKCDLKWLRATEVSSREISNKHN